MGVEAPLALRCAPAKKEDDVLAESFELFAIPVAEALAHPGQKQQRTFSPGDPEHSKEGPQLMRPQSSEGLSEGVQQHAHVATSKSARAGKSLQRPSPASLTCTAGSGELS